MQISYIKQWHLSPSGDEKFFVDRYDLVTWSEAEQNCSAIGATLAKISNRETQDMLTELLLNVLNRNTAGAWNGLNDRKKEGEVYTWFANIQIRDRSICIIAA